MLLKAGAKIDHPDARGRTAIHIAAENSNVDTIAALLEAGAQMTPLDRQTVVMKVVQRNASWAGETIRVLVRGGADVNAADPQGRTPLDFARFTANEDLVRTLTELGGRPGTLNSEDSPPLAPSRDH